MENHVDNHRGSKASRQIALILTMCGSLVLGVTPSRVVIQTSFIQVNPLEFGKYFLSETLAEPAEHFRNGHLAPSKASVMAAEGFVSASTLEMPRDWRAWEMEWRGRMHFALYPLLRNTPASARLFGWLSSERSFVNPFLRAAEKVWIALNNPKLTPEGKARLERSLEFLDCFPDFFRSVTRGVNTMRLITRVQTKPLRYRYAFEFPARGLRRIMVIELWLDPQTSKIRFKLAARGVEDSEVLHHPGVGLALLGGDRQIHSNKGPIHLDLHDRPSDVIWHHSNATEFRGVFTGAEDVEEVMLDFAILLYEWKDRFDRFFGVREPFMDHPDVIGRLRFGSTGRSPEEHAVVQAAGFLPYRNMLGYLEAIRVLKAGKAEVADPIGVANRFALYAQKMLSRASLGINSLGPAELFLQGAAWVIRGVQVPRGLQVRLDEIQVNLLTFRQAQAA